MTSLKLRDFREVYYRMEGIWNWLRIMSNCGLWH